MLADLENKVRQNAAMSLAAVAKAVMAGVLATAYPKPEASQGFGRRSHAAAATQSKIM
jgi:hypothetical protein